MDLRQFPHTQTCVSRGVVPGPRYAIVLWHVNEAAANALLR